MATTQTLKKKLRSIRSTGKIAKAMQTTSTAKFAKLNAHFAYFKQYCEQHRVLYEENKSQYDERFVARDSDAPAALIVVTGNKGMCGSFNTEMLAFAHRQIEEAQKPYKIYLCGKKAQTYFDEHRIPYEKAIVFSDVPKYSETRELFAQLCAELHARTVSSVKIAYSSYENITKQTPVIKDMFDETAYQQPRNESALFYPDESSVVEKTADQIMGAFIFEKIIESAIGAQASTLMAMRSAYDAAMDYSIELEREINQIRQKQVTADVIETSVDCTEEDN